MKLKKLNPPQDVYVVTSRNGVRLSKPESGSGAENVKAVNAELDVEDLDLTHGPVEELNAVAEAESG